MGMIRMHHVMKICLGAASLLVTLVPIAHADEFQLSQNQRISCSRGLSPGKLNTATCRSYAYIFNVKTSEYFRCSVSLALTRDNKEVINVQTDGGWLCGVGRRHHSAKGPRLHHHQFRPRLRHLEMPRHDVSVSACHRR